MCEILANVTGGRVTNPFERAWRIARDNSLLMMAGAVVALAWVNLAPASYEHWTGPLHFAINDVAMVFFFGVATKEIVEATSPGGPLQSMRRGAVPVIAAVGGMIGPALLYLALARAAGRPDLASGWAIPTATDIAFSYVVARTVFPQTHPAIPFLLLLAIADDAFGLLILALFYPSAPLQPAFLVLVLAACGLAWGLRRLRVFSFWPYILGAGAVSWVGLYAGGFHPALALVPILPFLPRAPHDPGVCVEGPHDPHDALTAFEHWWATPVEIALFFFALANAGVPLARVGAATWLVWLSLVAGKPIGIGVAVWIAERAGFRRDEALAWSDVVVLGVAAGVGLTVSLFFATAAFPPGAVLDEAKLGALFSVSAGVLAIGLARLFALR